MTSYPIIRRTSRCPTRRLAFTMAEMMIAITLMVIVTGVVASLFVQVRKMIGITQWAADTRTQALATVGTIANDLQNVNDRAYFLMLNRDYYWDDANARATKLYATDPDTATVPPALPAGSRDKAFWADRIAFLATGSYSSISVGSAGQPVRGTSARIYYGHDLWTHELPDAVWDTRAMNGAAEQFIQVPLKPPQESWTQGFQKRPAVTWSLVRQAVIQASADTAPLPQPTDCEFRLLNDAGVPPVGSLGASPTCIPLYSATDLTQWVTGNLDRAASPSLPPAWGTLNWAALLWAPRAYSNQAISDARALSFDASLAPARILMPHAARLRFQVRLNDGSVIPQLDNTNAAPLRRGGLAAQTYPITPPLPVAQLLGLNPDYAVKPPLLATDPYATWDPATLATTRSGPEIPVAQTLYAWTAGKTNLRWTDPSGATSLYPVAVRVRMEVYDPQRRTPDPIIVDEWVPVRWTSRPASAP